MPLQQELADDWAAIKAKLAGFLDSLPPGTETGIANEAITDGEKLVQKATDAVVDTAAPTIAPDLVPEWNAFLDAKAAEVQAAAYATISKYTAAKISVPA